jgi:chorismate-pyruvate lyase
MFSEVLSTLPLSLRICAVTDGSITYLLEAIFGGRVEVLTVCQQVVEAEGKVCGLLDVAQGEPVNLRDVTLGVDGVVYVYARSLSPVERMPVEVREQLMRADVPIGRILRANRLETRRDILRVERHRSSKYFECEVLYREYVIIHGGRVLMWINEEFPLDSRWDVC